MKQQLLKSLFTIACLLSSISMYGFEVDGIYYYYESNKTAVVTSSYDKYAGTVVIPETITYSGETYSVTSIGVSAFEGCSALTSVTIPNSVTSIGSRAFSGCSALSSVTIPNSVTSIGSEAFYNCDALTKLIIADGDNTLRFGSDIFDYSPIETIYLGRNLFYSSLSPTSYPFYNIDKLKSVTIGNSVTSIEDYAFYGCEALSSVTIGNSVTSIGSSAFYNCDALSSVTIPNSVTSIGSEAFYNCDALSSVTIPNSVTSIGSKAFSDCEAKVIWLTNTPPNGYTSANGVVNYVANDLYSSLRNVKVYPYLSSIFEVDGVKYVPVSPSERTCDAIDCLYDSTIVDIRVENSVSYKGVSMTVNEVMPYTFYENKNIKTITLNNTGNIGEKAFEDCSQLAEVTLGNNIKSIGESAFRNCDSIDNIIIPNSVTSIEDHVFSNCSGLRSVTIGNSVTSIKDYAFSGCSSLPQITIPQSVTSIADCVFNGCVALADVIISDREKTLSLGSSGSDPLFDHCPLDSVYIGGKITYTTFSIRGYSPFYRNSSLRTVVITDTETEIYDNEFYGCNNLTDVTIGDGVKKIGNWAFSGCSNLNHFTFGNSVESIGEEAFSDCTNVTKIISYTHNPPVCGTQALDDINKWSCTLHVHEDFLAAYQAADQWKDFFFVEGIESEGYKLIYLVDDEFYASETYFLGDAITPIKEPVKEGYQFSGWSEIPATMPANNVTVTGEFTFTPAINDNITSYVIEEDIYCNNFTYTRNFDNTDWQPWYMPFEVDYEDISKYFEVAYINNIHQYDYDDDGVLDRTELEAIKIKEGRLKANYPYIVKANNIGEKYIEIENISIVPTVENSYECSSMTNRYIFTGTYKKLSGKEITNNNYYTLNYNYLNTQNYDSPSLNAFRWYMTIENKGETSIPQIIFIRVEDNLTTIDGVTNDKTNTTPQYYDLSGRLVENPTQGIYIVKSGNTVKKVIINKH